MSIANQAAIVIENFRLVIESKVIKEELEGRKAIERAKGILMRQENLTEEAAYNLIRKYSMDNRKSMREVSEAIILNEEIKIFHKK
jgi:response regulator NasT